MRRFALCILALAAAGGAGCARKEPDPLDALLKRLGRQARRARVLQADFLEEKEVAHLAAPVRIEGTLLARVDPQGVWLRLEARRPSPSSVLVSPSEIRSWSSVERQFERSELARSPAFAGLVQGIFAFYGVSREDLERDFEVEAKVRDGPPDGARGRSTEVRIRPRDGAPGRQEGGYLEGPLLLAWDEKGLLPCEIAFAVGTERFRWVLSETSAPREISPEAFQLEPPPGVEPVDLAGGGE